MKKFLKINLYTALFIVLSSFQTHAARFIHGNSNIPEQTFDFKTGPSDLSLAAGCFFIGASEKKENNNFAVAGNCNGNLENSFQPLAPEKIEFNEM